MAAELVVRDLAAGYGESLVLRDASLTVAPGEVVCLMGRNGVGKTTLIRSVMGVLSVRSGQVRFNGVDLTRAEPHIRARAGIGYVPQGRGIFPFLSVLENLLMGFEAVDRVEQTAIDEAYDLFPVLSRMRRRVAGTLSGGQQQQLAIARALVRRPKLLLLDEPTEGIQPSIVQEIQRLIQSLRDRRETSVLVVEQFLDFAVAVADRYYVMDHGSIVASGRGSELADHAVREHLAV